MRGAEFNLLAGHPALDFVNTLDNRYDPARTVDLLASYRHLLQFCGQTGVLTPVTARGLSKIAPRRAAAALEKARDLREVIHRIFKARTAGGRVAPKDLADLNHFVFEALAHRQLVERDSAFSWEWVTQDRDAESPLWPLVLGAAELLASDRVIGVRQCEEQTCQWLFLDVSRNHSRRWCDMRVCGNRNKARRHYQKLTRAAW